MSARGADFDRKVEQLVTAIEGVDRAGAPRVWIVVRAAAADEAEALRRVREALAGLDVEISAGPSSMRPWRG